MKKIVLIGAPGSGKSDLAKREIPNYHCLPVDNYIDSWQKQTKIAVGEFATYIVNMQIALERLVKEQEWENFSKDVYEKSVMTRDPKEGLIITCGSIVETSVYQALNAFAIAAGYKDGRATERFWSDARTNLTMQWWGVFKHDTWKYDHAFYLPLKREDGGEKTYPEIIDQNIPDALENFQIEYTQLSEDPDKRPEEVAAKLQ